MIKNPCPECWEIAEVDAEERNLSPIRRYWAVFNPHHVRLHHESYSAGGLHLPDPYRL